MIDPIYVTANGSYVIGGDGSYAGMDQMNCGKVDETSIIEIAKNYGISKKKSVEELLETIVPMDLKRR